MNDLGSRSLDVQSWTVNATELYVGTGRSHAHSGLTPTHRHLACVLLLYCQCPVPVLLWQLWSGNATYQICLG